MPLVLQILSTRLMKPVLWQLTMLSLLKLVDVPQPVSLLTPSSALDSIAFFGLPRLLTAPESIDQDEYEVLYTLPT
uniref:Secreted protein n=1 Tax=Moniliophthora roreri TaxID=221103 RepID=A0A0W0FP39_MONRR